MSYFIFLGYYLITTLIIFIISYLTFKFIMKKKVDKISKVNEKILEDFFNNM